MMIHERIREARQQRGWTQAQLAQVSGISLGYIKQLEGGHKPNPTQDTLNKLARAFSVPVSTLLGEDDEFATPIPPVPTWRRMGVSEDRIAQAAAIWADLTRDQRDKLSGHLQASASSLAAVDALIQQVQVRLDALRAQVQAGNDPPEAADPIRPADPVEPEGSDNPTRHGNFSSILEM
jgi:transcriptional regulator with XRE-family HTH domain